jgi:hypothetical protein
MGTMMDMQAAVVREHGVTLLLEKLFLEYLGYF